MLVVVSTFVIAQQTSVFVGQSRVPKQKTQDLRSSRLPFTINIWCAVSKTDSPRFAVIDPVSDILSISKVLQSTLGRYFSGPCPDTGD